MSRRHAKIVITGVLATLEDLRSKNGTYLRGQVITSVTELADGDRIRIGAFELTFRSVIGRAQRRPKCDDLMAGREAGSLRNRRTTRVWRDGRSLQGS